MLKRFIMTAFGHNRTGILADVTKILYENECNLEDSEMTRLSDEIALIFLFTSNRDDIEETLSREFHRLEVEQGLPTYFRRIKTVPGKRQRVGPKYNIHINGVDQIGIIYKVSEFLTKKDVKIIHLSSKRSLAPLSATALYKVEMEVEFPKNLSYEEIRKGLREVGDQLHLDVQIE